MIYPSVIKNYKVYNASGGQFVGLAETTAPKLVFEKNDLKGAGLGGSFNLPVSGNVMPMTQTFQWHTNTLESLTLFNGSTAQVRCMSSIQMFDTAQGAFVEIPEEILTTLVSDEYDLGKRDASTKATVTQTYSVIYLAVFFNSQKFWEIDPFSNISIINGRDLNAQTRVNISG